MITKKRLHKICFATLLSSLAACGAQAYEVKLGTNLPPVDIHGFISQGYLLSSSYNYLDYDTTSGSFRFFEAGVNASFNPFPRTRITAQGFMFDVGDVGQYQPVLDYASAEYTFSDYLGVRGGRIRRSQGIYNQIVDLDLARTWVLLPQGMYDARWRDFYATLDGGAIFGSAPLSKAGSLSYETDIGYLHPSTEGGVAQTVKNQLPPGSSVDDLNSPLIVGEQLWWTTPLEGLRVGASYQHAFDFQENVTVALPSPPYPPGLTVKNTVTADMDVFQGSLEYIRNSWTFQAEYERNWFVSDNAPENIFDTWYASAAYRFNKWFEAGTYYTEYYNNVKDRNGSELAVPADGYQKDVALSLRFDITDWWIFKVEGHHINGTALLRDNAANPDRGANGWWMLAVKATFSF